MVLVITEMEMKGDLKECTKVGSKSHDLMEESSNASTSFHPSPFITDGLRPGIPNGGFSRVDGCDCENHNGMLSKLTLRLRFDVLCAILGAS